MAESEDVSPEGADGGGAGRRVRGGAAEARPEGVEAVWPEGAEARPEGAETVWPEGAEGGGTEPDALSAGADDRALGASAVERTALTYCSERGTDWGSP